MTDTNNHRLALTKITYALNAIKGVVGNADLDDGPILPPDEVHSYAIPQDSLNGLSMKELGVVCDVLHTTGDIISGFLCQPRFFKDRENEYNGAGRILEDFVLFVHSFEQAAIDTLLSAKPQSSEDIKEKAWALLSFEAQMQDNLSDFAVHAVEAVKDVMEAEGREGDREQA